MRRVVSIGALGIGVLLIVASATLTKLEAAEAGNPFPPVRLTGEEAREAGWERVVVNLGAPSLSYTTYLPRYASVETAPLSGDVPSGPGRVKVVAGYKLPFQFGEIEGTVTAIQLRDTGSAARLCGRMLESDGYVPRVTHTNPERTHAQIFSASFDKKNDPARGALTDCRTREHDLLVHHFVFPLVPATETPDLDARIDAALNVALPLLSNIEFDNGRPDGYGEAAEPLELKIGETAITLPIPKALSVSFNDFDRDSGARELHLLEQKDGKARAMVWLAVRPMVERPDLAKIGASEIARQLLHQSADLAEPRLLLNESTDGSEPTISTGQTFRFAVKDKQGQEAGILEGEAYWSEGRLVLVSLYSNLGSDDGSFNALIARLPSQTAYDLLRVAVRAEQE